MLYGLIATAVGVALLWKAADEFVEGAAAVARILRVSPIVIGAVIIGFGTSAPEMIVSGIAAAGGDGDLGVGNIIGSNIANLSLILGAAALLIPLRIDSSVLRREAPLATAAVIVFALLLQGGISLTEGVILLIFMVIGVYLLVSGTGGDNRAIEDELASNREVDDPLGTTLIRTMIGLVGTVGGAWVLVWGATNIADELGYNNGFVGLTLVAIGTSLPELVTAISCARAGQDELIVGNLLGSNIFNALGVGAVVGVLGDGVLVDPSLSASDLYIMLAVCIGVFAMMFMRRVIGRYEGIALLLTFAGFLLVTYLDEVSGSDALAMLVS